MGSVYGRGAAQVQTADKPFLCFWQLMRLCQGHFTRFPLLPARAAAADAKVLFLLELPASEDEGGESLDSLSAGSWMLPAAPRRLATMELPADSGSLPGEQLEQLPSSSRVMVFLEEPARAADDNDGYQELLTMELPSEEADPPLQLLPGAECSCRVSGHYYMLGASHPEMERELKSDEAGQQPPASSAGARASAVAGGAAQAKRRPAGIDDDALLRLLAEAYGYTLMSSSGRTGAQGLEAANQDEWLRRLQQLAMSATSDTVLALYSALRARHDWARLSDVYSALVRLREMGGEGAQRQQSGRVP